MPAASSSASGLGVELLQARAQHLAALAEGGGRHLRQHLAPSRAASGSLQGHELDDGGGNLGRRREGLGRQRQHDARLACATAPAPRGGRRPWCRARRRCARRPPSGTSAPCGRTTAATARSRASRRAAAWRRRRAGWRRSTALPLRRAEQLRPVGLERVAEVHVEPAGIALRRSRRAPARQRSSRSTATTRAAPSSSSARVSPPGPGPTSTTVRPSSGPAARAMRRVRLRSRMKFWPRLFLALRPSARITSRSGGRPSGLAPGRGSSARRRSCRRGARRAPRRSRRRASRLSIKLAAEARPSRRDVEGGAVVGRGAHERQPQRDVDAVSKASVLNGISAWS